MENNIEINNSPITPENLGKLVKLIQENIISGKIVNKNVSDAFGVKYNDLSKII